jgi:hypothetical protein
VSEQVNMRGSQPVDKVEEETMSEAEVRCVQAASAVF